MAHYLYILRSLKDGRLYVGETRDVRRRLVKHNAGLVQSTRHRRPLELVAARRFPDRRAALTYERFLKTLEGSTEKRILVEQGVIEIDGELSSAG